MVMAFGTWSGSRPGRVVPRVASERRGGFEVAGGPRVGNQFRGPERPTPAADADLDAGHAGQGVLPARLALGRPALEQQERLGVGPEHEDENPAVDRVAP